MGLDYDKILDLHHGQAPVVPNACVLKVVLDASFQAPSQASPIVTVNILINTQGIY